jgi:hypothetical protein
MEFDISREHALRSCSLVFVKTGEFLEVHVASSRMGPMQSEPIAASLQGLHKTNDGILDLRKDGRSLRVNLEGTSDKVKVSCERLCDVT